MKNIIIALFFLITLFLVSCGKAVVPSDKSTAPSSAQTTEPSASASAYVPTEPSSSGKTPEPTAKIPDGILDNLGHQRYFRHNGSVYLETSEKVFLNSIITGIQRPSDYIRKSDGNIYPICTKSDCDHSIWKDEDNINPLDVSTINCVSRMIYNLDTVYDAPMFINSRIYFYYLLTLFSCDDDLGDLRVEFSFFDENKDILTQQFYTQTGKKPRTSDSPPTEVYDYYPVVSGLCNDGDQIIFSNYDENQTLTLYRYDTTLHKLFDITEIIEYISEKTDSSDFEIMIRNIEKGKIYIEVIENIQWNMHPVIYGQYPNNQDYKSDHIAYYAADYKICKTEEVDIIVGFPDFIIENGRIVREYKGSDGTSSDYVFCSNNGEKSLLIENIEQTLGVINPDDIQIKFLYGSNLYFCKTENKVIGKLFDIRKKEQKKINRSGGKIYRYDIVTGEIKCVFNDDICDMFNNFYIDEKSGIAVFSSYISTFLETDPKDGINIYDRYTTPLMIICQIDENGIFIDEEALYQ